MFSQVKEKVEANFSRMDQSLLFQINVDRKLIWELYLNGFPAEERQGHDCNACKSFLRQFGGLVSIQNNQLVTLWDGIEISEYTAAIAAVRDHVRSLPIANIMLNEFAKLGVNQNFDSVRSVTWQHFYVKLPPSCVVSNPDEKRGNERANKEVLERGLQEIPLDVTQTVLELIAQGSLYRGNEFEGLLKQFQLAQKEYVRAENKDLFCWVQGVSLPAAVCRIKNSSIGTLLVNLSEGMDLDTAVAKYEAVVAPSNYKRPTALVTGKMVEQAKAKLEEMGLVGSLERRFANEADLHTEDILFKDKSSVIKDVFDEVKKEAAINPRSLSKTEEITIEDFLARVLPECSEVKMLLERKHLPNMVSLLTAADPAAKSLFKWDNPFSWSYTGGITDSVKERVKAAGGNVDGVLRVSLSWFNFDDLDLHVVEPNGFRIYYGDKRSVHSGGTLDVDMNAGSGTTRNAVENIIWTNESTIPEGEYKVFVNNYSLREKNDIGYDIQIEYKGEIFEFGSTNSPKNSETDLVVAFNYSKTEGISFADNVKSSVASVQKWGLNTNVFHKVKLLMLSPNHWDKNVGNKHFLFFLEDCQNDEQPRPFFNEFLKEEFSENRKVFEVLGSKVKIEPTPYQLSGVGFSDTQRNSVYVQVKSKFTRTLKINF